MDKLGDEFKSRELSQRAEPYEFICLRFDGRCFSKFTKNLKKPFDDNFQLAMKLTLKDTMEEFMPTVGYVFSDEISLVFSPLCSKKSYFHIKEEFRPKRVFNGRKDKLITLIASFISVRFNINMGKILGSQIFDGRMLIFSEDEENLLYDYFRWRMTDCYRNCVSGYSRSFFSAKELLGKNVDQQIKMMKDIDFDFSSIGDSYKYGIFMKKKIIEKEGIDFKSGEHVLVNRTVIEERIMNKEDLHERLFTEKHW